MNEELQELFSLLKDWRQKWDNLPLDERMKHKEEIEKLIKIIDKKAEALFADHKITMKQSYEVISESAEFNNKLLQDLDEFADQLIEINDETSKEFKRMQEGLKLQEKRFEKVLNEHEPTGIKKSKTMVITGKNVAIAKMSRIHSENSIFVQDNEFAITYSSEKSPKPFLVVANRFDLENYPDQVLVSFYNEEVKKSLFFSTTKTENFDLYAGHLHKAFWQGLESKPVVKNRLNSTKIIVWNGTAEQTWGYIKAFRAKGYVNVEFNKMSSYGEMVLLGLDANSGEFITLENLNQLDLRPAVERLEKRDELKAKEKLSKNSIDIFQVPTALHGKLD